MPSSQTTPTAYAGSLNGGGPSAHLLSGPPGPGPSVQALQPPALPSNASASGTMSRQLAHPPPPPPGAPANGTPAGEEAMVAAIIRDGEVSLATDMGDWRPPTNPSLERLVKETELTWLAAGGAAEAVGEYGRAVDCYERALRQNPLSAPALTKAAGIYRHQENFKLAADYFSRLLKIHEGSGEIWGALGHCYLMIDDLQKAYTSYQQALHHFQTPKSEPKLWYGIGILYDRYGSLEHAEEAFSSVIRMDPNFEKANEIYFRLGIIYKQQRKAELSLECFQWILDKPPSPLTEIDIWFQVGHVHEQQGHFDRAKEAYERVLAENSTHAKVLQQLGGLYCREGSSFYNPEEAVAILTRSLAADSHDSFSWYLLGRAYMTTQNFNKAYEAYQQAVYRDGKNPAFWCSIGVLYSAIAQYHDSLDAYSRAIRINPYISEVWYNLGALYESCNDQMLDAIDAYQRAAQLDGNNAHINQRLAEIKHHQDTGGPLGSPPTPRDMSHTSANWPLPNTLNGGPEQYFGSTGSGALSHSQDDAHRPTPPGPIPMSPTTNTQHSASTHAPSPLTSRPNGVRPGTASSSIVMRPQSAGPFGHVAPPPQSVTLNGSHPANQHHPSAHPHPSAVPHTSSHSSTMHRRQSGGYAHLAPMDFEPSPHVTGRAPLPAQHNLPHIRSVVDSQSRGPSPAPAPENLRRGPVMAGPGSRELISPRTSPLIRSGPGPGSNERGGGYPSNNSAAPPHSSHAHPGPPPYSRYPSSHPILDDAPPSAPPSSIGTNNVRDRSSRESARFRHHSPEYRGSGPSERDGRSSSGPGSQSMYPGRGEFGGPGYNIPPQPQHQSPYDPRHASSPNMRGPPSNVPRFSPTENGQSPTWSSTDLRSGPGPVYAPGPQQDERRPPSQPGYVHHHSQPQAPPPPSVSHHHSQPPPRRYDPRFDEGPVGPPPIRHSVPNEHASPHRPSSTGLGRSNAEMEAAERQRSLGPARHVQPSPTPSTELSSTATRRGPRSKPTAANQSRQKEEEGSPVPQVRRRKPNGLGNGRTSQTQSQSSVAPAGRSPPVSEPVSVPVSAPKERRERKKVGSGGSNGAKLKTKLNESVRGPSPVTVVPAPIPMTLPDRKVDEEFEEYDEVADALLSFAGQPRRQVGSSPSDESGKKSPGSGSGSGNTLQDSRSGSSPKVTVPLPPPTRSSSSASPQHRQSLTKRSRTESVIGGSASPPEAKRVRSSVGASPTVMVEEALPVKTGSVSESITSRVGSDFREVNEEVLDEEMQIGSGVEEPQEEEEEGGIGGSGEEEKVAEVNNIVRQVEKQQEVVEVVVGQQEEDMDEDEEMDEEMDEGGSGDE